MRRKKVHQFKRQVVLFRSSRACSWLAIFSLIFSSALTLTHHHGGGQCGCGTHQHSASAVAGLESLPTGDCDCSSCEEPSNGQQEHDEDSCSICRMVFEHAVQIIEFDMIESNELSCDIVAILFVTPIQSTASGYLTRGPPSTFA